ncbi:MAG: outer membrane protein assembly factor BamB family protein [Planctomycetota bacterium]|jgi:outer membrane protein assembly factor BamB
MIKGVSIVLVLIGLLIPVTPLAAQDLAGAAGVQGGFVVWVGCEDAKQLVSLGGDDGFIVQGLSNDPESVAAARRQVKSAGAYGRISVGLLDGRELPYIDNMVNLLVVSDAGELSAGEIERVLVPGGVALVKRGQRLRGLTTARVDKLRGWRAFRKPWPEEIDEWTHFLHDAQGTSVSDDQIAGHPRGLQWTGGPFWARSHEHTASMQAMVSTAGRVFYVMDEGPTESIQLPAEMYLTARDAFNGTVLWKRPLHNWWNALYPLKSGPSWLPRRLVAVGDRVYIAPGVGQDLLCLDAATGKTVCTYPDSASTFELIVSDGVVFAAVDPDRVPVDYNQQNADCWKERDRASILWGWSREKGQRLLKAMQADTGRVLWEKKMPVAPITLAADDRMVCFYDGIAVIALDRKTGAELWNAPVSQAKLIRTGYGGPRLVIHEDRVLFSPEKEIHAISAKTGDILWTVKNKPRSGHFSLEDFYIIDNKVWALQRANRGAFTTYGLADGSVLGEYTNPIQSFYIHQRCYPGRATVKYQLPPIMGTPVYDMAADTWTNNHWFRGGCVYGMMPANGMVYSTPSACACYYQSKLNGFNAVSPTPQPAKAPPANRRLTKGPAYGAVRATSDEGRETSNWPTFRHDNKRTGYVKTDVTADIEQSWKKDFGGKISQPTVAGGKLFLSAVDEHTIYALDASSGREAWDFIAGGRVDSSPTIYKGLAIFGCADGFVYALSASNGQLAWKFQAAPSTRRLMSYGQPESVWPLSGSTLIQDGRLYCVAGRSMFVDGGLRMLILNPETGNLLSENVMDTRVPGTDKHLEDLLMGKHMPVSMPDILSSDGKYVYMKSQTFTTDGKRVRIKPQRPDTQYDEEVHLFSPISFLDDAWHQRTYLIYGRAAGEGWAEFQFPPKRVPCGRVMCIDEENAYSYGRDLELLCNTSVSEYRLFSAGKIPTRKVGIPRLEGGKKLGGGNEWPKVKYPIDKPLASNSVNWHQLAKQPKDKLSALDYNWIHEEPDVMAKAMVLANDKLFIAGPRDVADEKELWGRSNEKLYQQKMAAQAAWFKGTHGGYMQVFSKKDGTKLAERKLDYLPAFDGLVAAKGRLYMATQCGSVVCYK